MGRKLKLAGGLALALACLAILSKRSAAPTANETPPAESPADDAARRQAAIAKAAEGARVSAPYIPENPPHLNVTLVETNGQKGGFGVALLMSFKIKNANAFDVKDPVIVCNLFGNSGTPLGSRSQTVYERLPKGATRSFRNINFGLVEQQVARFACRVTGVTSQR